MRGSKVNPSSVLLIYNPSAGAARATSPFPLSAPRLPLLRPHDPADTAASADPEWLAPVVEILQKRFGKRRVETFAGATPEETRERVAQAARAGCELVVAAGGDGTLRAVAGGLAGSDTALGILPFGTVNVLARELGIPIDDVEDALDVCLKGETRRIDLGRVGDDWFLLMASAGFDALAVRDVSPELKSVVGGNAYVVSGIAALSKFAPPHAKVTLDGAVWYDGPAFTVVAAGSSSYGGDFRIAPDAVLNDGLLDVVVFAAPTGPLPIQRAAFVRQVGAVTLGLAAMDPEIHSARAASVEIAMDPVMPAQIDGDASGATPLQVEVAPEALAVKIPK